jgi:hypothetical protein
VSIAEGLISQSPDGILPSVTWLKKNGHTGLYQYMRAHPYAFAHMKQHRRGVRSHDEKVKERQVALAKKLARKNGGTLPSVTWLTENDYSGLLSYIWKHPEFFEDIQREVHNRTPQEHVEAAENLARKYGGRLPGSWKIVNEGGWALYQFMRRNPKLFAHLAGAPKPEKRINARTSKSNGTELTRSRKIG